MKRTYLCTACNSNFTSRNISSILALKNHQSQSSCSNKKARILIEEPPRQSPQLNDPIFECIDDNFGFDGPSLPECITSTLDSSSKKEDSPLITSCPDDHVKNDHSCTSVLQYQHMLSTMYEKDAKGDYIYKPITIRKLKNKKHMQVEPTQVPERIWEDTVDIFNFWVKANVSVAVGDNLLALIQRILERNISNNSIKMPSTFKSIKEACTKREKELFPTTQFSFHLPSELYGTTDLRNRPLLPEQSTMHDIGPAIGRELLLIDPKNFAFTPDIVVDEVSNERCYGVFSTGTLFESLHHSVQNTSPYVLQEECPTVALALAVSSDTTTLDKGQNITGNGMQLFILNVCGISRKPIFLGMIPEKFRKYSNKTLHFILKLRGFTVKEDREKIIGYTLRQMKLQFMHSVLEKTLEYQNTGIYLQVGSSRSVVDADTSQQILAYPHTTAFLSDTLEANVIAGVAMKTKFPCRMCLQHDCSNCLVDSVYGTPRDDREHCQVSTDAGKYTLAEQTVIEKAASLCIKFGPNPLYRHFSKQNDWLINSLHQAVLVDYLHTLWKGLIEFLISQCLISFIQVSRLDKASYQGNLATLDMHISNFPIAFQTLLPWKMTRFSAGVTPFLKQGGDKKQGKTSTGFFSGSIAAWRLPGLLAQMLYSIPQNGSLLPTGHASTKKFFDIANDKKSSVRIVDQMDIQRTVIEAIEFGLDVEMIAHAPFMKESDILSFRQLLSNAIYRANQLFRLNSLLAQLKRDRSKKQPSKTVYVLAKLPQGIKHHLLAHLVDQFSRVGKDKSSCDTMISENYNITMKSASQRTSQKVHEQGHEMSRSMNMKNVASMYEEMITPVENRENLSKQDNTSHLGLSFHVVNNCSHQSIEYKQTIGGMVLQLRHAHVENHGIMEDVSPFFSNLLTWDQLYKLSIIDFNPSSGNQLRLLRSLKCEGSSQHGIEEFMIQCNPHHFFDGNKDRKCSQECFGFVKVKVETASLGDLESAPTINEYTVMVLAIIEESSYAVKENDRIIVQRKLCVLWLEEVPQGQKLKMHSSGKQIQFVFKSKDKKELWVDFIDTDSIVSPVFVMPIASSSKEYVFGGTFLNCQKEIKFSELDLERVKFWSSPSYDNFTQIHNTASLHNGTQNGLHVSSIIIPQVNISDMIKQQEWDLVGTDNSEPIDYFDEEDGFI